IVDLERYQKLHERSASKLREFRAHVEALQAQLAGAREVTDEQLQEAAEKIALAEEGRAKAAEEVERWTGLLHQARQWRETQARLEAARQKWRQAEALLGDSVGIERDFARLRELREALPHVKTVVSERSSVTNCEKTAAALTAERQQQAAKV